MNTRGILKFHKNFATIYEIRSAEFPSIYQNAVKFQLEILSQGTLVLSFFKNPSQQKLIFLSSLAFVMFFNFSFFKNIINAYGISGLNFIYLVCDMAALIAFLTLFFTIFSSRYTTKPILMICFFISSFTAYFMDSYNVVIDSEMIRNAAQTNFAESADLFSPRLAIYVLVL
ncbi:DUF1705 domain-containing protein, partial [uncultured Campylobacter sp.]